MIRKFWAFVSNTGIKPENDLKQIKRFTLLNQYLFIALVIYALNALTDLVYGYPFDALILGGSGVLLGALFYFKKQHDSKYILATFIYISLTIFYFGTFASIQAGDYLYYFPLVLAISFAFDFKKDKAIMIFLFCFITLLLLIYAFMYGASREITMENGSERYQMFMINLAISASTIGFFIYLTVEDNRINSELYEQRLREKEESETLIKKTLAEKEILLQELHHRVKNNLAVIVSYFNLKLNSVESEEARLVLHESRNHVNSMALIHNRVYKTGNFSDINFAVYLRDLLKEIQESYPAMLNRVRTSIHIEDVKLNLNAAVPCALILNELLSNCYKHAFKHVDEGEIEIRLVIDDHDRLTLTLRDNGSGLDNDFDQHDSLGVSVIRGLSEQLNGSSRFYNDGGACFILTFNRT